MSKLYHATVFSGVPDGSEASRNTPASARGRGAGMVSAAQIKSRQAMQCGAALHKLAGARLTVLQVQSIIVLWRLRGVSSPCDLGLARRVLMTLRG